MHQVRSVLKRYATVGEPLSVEPLGSAGGMSGAQFWRINVRCGSPDPACAAFCLRRWPTEHPTPERLRFIHSVLAHAERHGIKFLAVPLCTIRGVSFVEHAGHLWELAPWLPGVADYQCAPNFAKLNAAMAALASFHNATNDFPVAASQRPAGAPSPISKRLARLQQLMHGSASELAASIDDAIWPELARLARQFIAAVPGAIPPAIAQLVPLTKSSLPVQPCLRDVWHDHVLFSGAQVTGIIDYGAVDIDTPATDVARLLGSLSPFPFSEGLGEGLGLPDESKINSPWRAGLAAYAAVRPLSDAEQRAVGALDTAATILAGCNWIRWIYVEGRSFENQTSIIERFRRLLRRLNV